MSDHPMTKLIAQTAEKHGLGWIDNGKASARCYCGHIPRIGESWHWHLADAVIAELQLERQEHYDPSVSAHRFVTDWKADDE